MIKYNKFKNRKVIVDDIKFDSKHESEVYKKLKVLESNKSITDLRLQVPFILQEGYSINGRKIRPIKYVADFVFVNENGETEVWDAKGMKTEVYKLKKKIFEYKYSMEIKEV